MKRRTLDTDKQVFFYEQEFYVLSNFSAFSIDYGGFSWPTAEHCYQAQKFLHENVIVQEILNARSAHGAFKIAERYKSYVSPGWNDIKLIVMKNILMMKVYQHEYVYRKLMETKDRELIENSWRDSYWGEGLDRNGSNHLGKLWMEIRESIKQGEAKAKKIRDALVTRGDGDNIIM